jgi:hypothetical protein
MVYLYPIHIYIMGSKLDNVNGTGGKNRTYGSFLVREVLYH